MTSFEKARLSSRHSKRSVNMDLGGHCFVDGSHDVGIEVTCGLTPVSVVVTVPTDLSRDSMLKVCPWKCAEFGIQTESAM